MYVHLKIDTYSDRIYTAGTTRDQQETQERRKRDILFSRVLWRRDSPFRHSGVHTHTRDQKRTFDSWTALLH